MLDIADQFRRGEFFKATHQRQVVYGAVIEYNRALIIAGIEDRSFKLLRSHVLEDATRLSESERVKLPREVSLVLEAVQRTIDY